MYLYHYKRIAKALMALAIIMLVSGLDVPALNLP